MHQIIGVKTRKRHDLHQSKTTGQLERKAEPVVYSCPKRKMCIELFIFEKNKSYEQAGGRIKIKEKE